MKSTQFIGILAKLQRPVGFSWKTISVSLFLGFLISPSSLASFSIKVTQPHSLSQTPEALDNSDTPNNLDTSDTPDTPEIPEIPEIPDNLDTPDTPDNLDTPDTPDTPEIPEIPDNLDTPDTPEIPDNLDTSVETQIPLANDPLIGQWRSLDSSLPPRDFIFRSEGKLTIVYQYSSGVITREGQYRVSPETNYPRAIDLILPNNKTIQTIFQITDDSENGKLLSIELKGVNYGDSRPSVITDERERKFQQIDETGLVD